MKLTDESVSTANLVRAFAPGELRVRDTVLQRSCLLRADRIIAQWRPQTLDELTLEDLQPVFELEPEILILGTGAKQKFPPPALLAAVLSRGIGCEVMDTGAACRTYNVLVTEDRPVVAALFLKE
jgi:uncharacterized protein